MFGSVRSPRQDMRMRTIGIAADQWASGFEGIPCIEQGYALHQLVQAVSEPIRPGGLHMHVAASNGTDDSFAGLPQSAGVANRTSILCPHTLLVFKVSRVLERNLPAESLHPVGSG